MTPTGSWQAGTKMPWALLIRHHSQPCWGGGEPGPPSWSPQPGSPPCHIPAAALLKLGFHSRRAFDMSGCSVASQQESAGPQAEPPLERSPGWAEGDFKASLSSQPPSCQGRSPLCAGQSGDRFSLHLCKGGFQEQGRPQGPGTQTPQRPQRLCPALGAPGCPPPQSVRPRPQKRTPELAGEWQHLGWVGETPD